MRIVAVLVDDVAECEHIQLLVRPTPGDINGKQDRHRYAAANEADCGRDFQVAEQEEAIKRVMV